MNADNQTQSEDFKGNSGVHLLAAAFAVGVVAGAAPLAAPLTVGYKALEILGVGREVYKFCQWLTSEE